MAFQHNLKGTKGTAGAKALRQESPWCIQGGQLVETEQVKWSRQEMNLWRSARPGQLGSCRLGKDSWLHFE